MALQVEKTSKRGGRIIHEKELSAVMPPPALSGLAQIPQGDDSPTNATATNQPPKQEPSITEIMRSPSKVVLLRVSIYISGFIENF